MRRRHLRKIAQKARREFEAGKAVLPRGKVINRPVVTNLWVNGRASEDRDEWTEEVRAHCERCYDDKEETSEVQAERIQRQRRSGNRRVALHGRRVMITRGQGSAGTRENAPEKGQWSSRLPGDRNVAMSPDTDRVPGGTLVRQTVQR